MMLDLKAAIDKLLNPSDSIEVEVSGGVVTLSRIWHTSKEDVRLEATVPTAIHVDDGPSLDWAVNEAVQDLKGQAWARFPDKPLDNGR